MHAKREKSMLRKVALWDGGGLAEVRRKVAGYCTADNGVGATSVQGLTADRTHVNKPTYFCSHTPWSAMAKPEKAQSQLSMR